MTDLTRREFLATSIAASTAVVLSGRAAPVETGGLSTDFSGLDQLIGGLQDGQLVVIAGWPGVGKTALALAMARQTAVEDSKGTLCISLDRSQDELAERLLCSHAGVPCQALRNSQLSECERQEIVKSAAELSASPLFVYDRPLSVARLCEFVCQLNREQLPGRVRLLVVDALQLIEPEEEQELWQEQLLQITSDLKTLAVELRLPVVGTIQMNPADLATRTRRPRLSDIRATGPIEPYSDLIIFVHRPGNSRCSSTNRISRDVELIVAKHQSGPLGSVRVGWDSACARFGNLGGPT